ncbi:MAG TPA: M24 family metallopeptidase [Gaiellaceae bacterium]
MARRYALARGLLADEGLDFLVVFGNSGVNRHNHANGFWLSQWQDLHHCYLVVPHDGEATLLVGLVNHVPNAREVSDVPVIEWGGYEPGKTIAALVHGRVGLVGVNATWSDGMPWRHYLDLQAAGVELVDVTREYASLRRIKSAEEVERLRGAAELSDLAITTLVEVARPGVAETELVALVEESYRRRGGTTRITFLRSMPMDAPNGCLPAQNPSSRRLERGDVIITEFSASLGGYSGQVHRPVFVQAEPTAEWLALFDAARDAYEAITRGMTPGSTEGDVISNARVLGERGYAIYDDLIHGYGTDYGPPLVDRSCVQYWQDGVEPPAGRTIEEGMTIVVQPNPITPDERMGLQLGALTVVTAAGAESLHGLPLEPLLAA